jgi:hypothetical protein
MPSRLSRYWHTLRHLRPVQLYGRIAFRLARPRPDTRPAPAVRALLGPWLAPARRKPSLAGPRKFCILNVDGSLDEIGWDGPEREKLWRYNQHYFDDLNALNAGDRSGWHLDLLSDWVAGYPPAIGNGWEPYPTSLRIVNWIKWSRAGNLLPKPCIESLAVQARWLTRRLEVHLLGNHLFANAKALVFAGLFFEGEEAAGWLSQGLNVLSRQMPEQILADGGQFERSPMYHALALEDVLDLCNVAVCLRRRVRRPWTWIDRGLAKSGEAYAALARCDVPSGWRDLFFQRCGDGYCAITGRTQGLCHAPRHRCRRGANAHHLARVKRLRPAGFGSGRAAGRHGARGSRLPARPCPRGYLESRVLAVRPTRAGELGDLLLRRQRESEFASEARRLTILSWSMGRTRRRYGAVFGSRAERCRSIRGSRQKRHLRPAAATMVTDVCPAASSIGGGGD